MDRFAGLDDGGTAATVAASIFLVRADDSSDLDNHQISGVLPAAPALSVKNSAPRNGTSEHRNAFANALRAGF